MQTSMLTVCKEIIDALILFDITVINIQLHHVQVWMLLVSNMQAKKWSLFVWCPRGQSPQKSWISLLVTHKEINNTVTLFYLFVSWPPQREAGDVRCFPPLSGISGLSFGSTVLSPVSVLLPPPIAISVFSFFSAYWPILLTFFFLQKILQYFSFRDGLFGMACCLAARRW